MGEEEISGLPHELAAKISFRASWTPSRSMQGTPGGRSRSSWSFTGSKACADAEQLELYDSDEEERESYSSGERTLYVDSVTGEFVGMLLIARSREELKKLLLLEAHSFVPDPDSDAPGMTSFSTIWARAGCSAGSLNAGSSLMITAQTLILSQGRSPGKERSTVENKIGYFDHFIS